MSDSTATLANLVRRPSVNPMGRDVSGPEYLEGRVTEYLVQRFASAGLPYTRHTVAPGRENVLARLEATVPGAPVVLWDAHQDTVPADGMTIEPFTPHLRDGRLYGRGACDVKGGMAAMLVALDRLRTSEAARHLTVLFSATVNEEFGFSGARALARLWMPRAGDEPAADAAAREFAGPRPAAAIVAEPTELDIVTQHKGAVRWRARIHGRACHSSFPEQGENAIYHAARVILAIEALAAELLTRNPGHPCGPPTLSLGTVRGGSGVNLVPDLVVLEIERRVLPGECPQSARDEVVRRIAEAAGSARIEHDEPFLESGGLSDDHPGARRLAETMAAAEVSKGSPRRLAARYGTNASVYAGAGVPCVVFGPGSIAQAHTVDEWIEIAQVDAAADILTRFVQHPAGVR